MFWEPSSLPAFWRVAKCLPRALKQRRQIMARRRVSDEELVELFNTPARGVMVAQLPRNRTCIRISFAPGVQQKSASYNRYAPRALGSRRAAAFRVGSSRLAPVIVSAASTLYCNSRRGEGAYLQHCRGLRCRRLRQAELRSPLHCRAAPPCAVVCSVSRHIAALTRAPPLSNRTRTTWLAWAAHLPFVADAVSSGANAPARSSAALSPCSQIEQQFHKAKIAGAGRIDAAEVLQPL